jgi:hypothetical protein
LRPATVLLDLKRPGLAVGHLAGAEEYRRHWNPERVIARCREWAEQTGSPPSYYDWAPVARGAANGSSSPLAAK